MPPKIRQLKAALVKAGFDFRPGKGSQRRGFILYYLTKSRLQGKMGMTRSRIN